MSLYLANYDIASNWRRRRVARALCSYGKRVQESVFEVWLEPEEINEFRRTLGPLLHPDDAFDVYPIDLDPRRARFRWQRPIETFDSVIER